MTGVYLIVMGILGTEWDAELEGHKLAVKRNELTKGFKLEWDGEVIASRSWSLVGLGELHASAEANGKQVEIKVTIEFAGFNDGKCTITVDGQEIPVRHVK